MDLLPPPADAPRNVLIGFSGGRDSTVLLHRLVEWCRRQQRTLRAIHIHHGLQPGADDWAQHCEQQAAALGVPCAVLRVAVQPDGHGWEEAARRARYAALAAERRDDECVALAHHRGDQAETVLLALLRGSGERGLAAMRLFTWDARGPLWRPLLDTPPEALAAYANTHGLRWIDDPSNADVRLSRNRLRHEVMPLLRQHWPQAEAALARSAATLAEADALLDHHAARDLAGLQGLAGDSLDLPGLHALPHERATRVLRAWARDRGVILTRDAMRRVLGPWRDDADGRNLRHALGGWALHQWQRRLWLVPRADSTGRPSPHADVVEPRGSWDGRTPLHLPDGGRLLLLGAPGLDRGLEWRPRPHAPARFRSSGDRHARPLKSVFAGLGIPPWQRDRVPLLVDPEGRLQALGDLAYGAELEVWLRDRGARLLWQPAGTAG